MKYSDLIKKKPEELKQLISDYRAELFSLRFKNATRQLDKTHRIDAIKKDIARALTAFNQMKMIPIENVTPKKEKLEKPITLEEKEPKEKKSKKETTNKKTTTSKTSTKKEVK